MDDQLLLRDRIAIERQRDEAARLDRINSIETAVAVLKTRFDDALGRAVSGEDLKKIEREMEQHMITTVADLRQHMINQTEQQSDDILGQVRTMFSEHKSDLLRQQLEANAAMLAAIQDRRSRALWWVLGILGAIFATIAATLITVNMIGKG